MISRIVVLLCVVVGVVVSVPVDINYHQDHVVTVSPMVFSGTENPVWVLTQKQAKEIPFTAACDAVLPSYYPVLGYQGFRVSVDGLLTEMRGCVSVEKMLLQTGKHHLEPAVYDYISSLLNRLDTVDTSKPGPNAHVRQSFNVPSVADVTPIVGPDTPPVFDPDHDDSGDFETHCTLNNCYNYGTDVATDTFAQPGRGSGKKWQMNTCENMNASAILDGLTWVGTDVPATQPEKGHYVALYIWPGTNFHWARMDSNMKWSHKPGQTPVKNTDNNGQEITDPKTADLSPWSQYCGIMHVVPSQIHIN